MIKPRTLAAQLGVQISLTLVVVWILATVISLVVLMRDLNASYDKTLQETAQRLLPLAISDYRLHEVGILDLRPDLSLLHNLNLGISHRILTDQPEYLLYQLRDWRGKVLLRSHNAPINPMLPAIRPGFTQIDNFRIYTASTPDGRYHIQVAESAKHRYGVLIDSLMVFLMVFVLALPVSVLLVVSAVRRRLRPINLFTSAISKRHGQNLEEIRQVNLPDDFLQVQEATNALLERLRSALAAEREFAANSAHELRTPLAVALVQLQRLRQELGETDQGLRIQAVESSLKRLARLVDKLLQLARAESAALYSGEPVDALRLLEMIARELDPYRERIEIVADAQLLLKIDPDAFAVILSNLIENGLKYAPPESPVIVRLTAEDAIQVENLAPELDETQLDSLQARFVRGADRTKPGAGLGLAIVGAFCQQLGIGRHFSLIGKGRGQRLRVELDFRSVSTRPAALSSPPGVGPALPSPRSD